jgi:hypothetical protein
MSMLARAKHRVWSPISILGSACLFWARCNSFTVSTGVSGVTELTRGQTLTQATTSRQPTTYGLLSGTGHYGIQCDGVDDMLIATLTSPIAPASSARPYIWLVGRLPSLPAAIVHGGAAWDSATSSLVLAPMRCTTTNFTALLNGTDGDETIVGPAVDTNIHLFEAGLHTATTNRLVVDGTGYSGVHTGAAFRGLDRVQMFGVNGGASGAVVQVYEIVLASSIPNTAQLSAMRSMFRSRGYGIAVA